MLVLASQSPRRRELLAATGLAFRVMAPTEARTAPPVRARYSDLVRRAALAKARSVAGRAAGVVLGADTIVVCDGRVMGKPASRGDARSMLEHLSGRWHRVYTGLALVSGGRYTVGHECTKVAFRRLSKGEIERYVRTGEPMDKAGAYGVQGRGGAFVRSLQGCYTNVVGLPLPKLLVMLEQFEGGAASQRGPRPGGC